MRDKKSNDADRAGTAVVITFSVVLSIVLGVAQCVFVVSPTLRDLLSLDADTFGWLLSSSMILGIAGTFLGGLLADRGWLRATAYGSILILSSGYGLCALSQSFAPYLVGIALTGFAGSALSTIANVAVMRSNPNGARRAVSWMQISFSAASTVSPPIWAWMLERFSEGESGAVGAVHVIFAVAAIASLAAIFALIGRELPEACDESAGGGDTGASQIGGTFLESILGVPFIMVSLFVVLHASADNGAYLWVPDFVERRFDPSPFPAAWILSGYSAAYFVGKLTLIHLPERWRDVTIISWAAGGGSVFFFLAFQSGSQYLVAVLYIVGGLFMAMDFPSILSHVNHLFPRSAGRVMATTSAMSQAVSVFTPPLMGWVGQRAGTMAAGMAVPSVFLGVLSISAVAWRKHLDRTAATTLP